MTRTLLPTLFLLALTGCGSIRTSERPVSTRMESLGAQFFAAHRISDVTADLLRRHRLTDDLKHDPCGVIRAVALHSDPDRTLALAELSYRMGLMRQHGRRPEAMPWYRAAAGHAARALAEPGLDPRDPRRAGLAVSVHNDALARLIRLAVVQAGREGRPWQAVVADLGLGLDSTARQLEPRRLSDLRVAGDFKVTGMQECFTSTGLGVPLIAFLPVDPNSPDVQERYLPEMLRSAATGVIEPGAGPGQPDRLVLLDPFRDRQVDRGGRPIRLASDRTTPLAVQVADSALPELELAGLITSSFERIKTGVYMTRPYERGKIPVVFVHGLFSSPRAWVQTINILQNDPALRDRYQFWVFLYPSGLPLGRSGAELRKALRRVRADFDPERSDPAFDRMVLVGHSMGGILSKMMIQDSGMTYWNGLIRRSPEELVASPATLEMLKESLIFKPVPEVRRVIFVASPHRGSHMANRLIGRVTSNLIRPPSDLKTRIDEVLASNGPDAVDLAFRGKPRNSINNLAWDNPVLRLVEGLPVDPTVPYHSIILRMAPAWTDGAVAYRSAHLEGAASELVLPGSHFDQQKPTVTVEIRRILVEHLAGTASPPYPVASAARPSGAGPARR